MNTIVETDILIVGAGPAGGSLASFLAQNGLTALMISSAPGTADTPRAHLVNPSTVECLRDIGLEDAAYKIGVHGERIENMRWCHSLLGREFARAYSWGGAPTTTLPDVVNTSPCKFVDLPQTLMEPLFIKFATENGIRCRFSTKLISIERKNGQIYSTVEDLITKGAYQIISRYIFGCDGGRSTVARSLNFKMQSEPSGGVACNILLEVDVGDHMQNRFANLHWVMQPDSSHKFGMAPVIRMVKPWFQWMIVCFTPDAAQDPFQGLTPDSPQLIQYVKDLFGDQNLDIKILRLDPWTIRESIAEKFSDYDVFMLGDSIHRHPPMYGLGSNTCVQEAFNLAWKIAYVEKGIAGRRLLDTYNEERWAVGAQLVRESNECMRRHVDVWTALGMFAGSPEAGAQVLKELSEASEAGSARREQLHKSIEGKRRETESLGITRNQVYVSSAVYLDDEAPAPKFDGDPIVNVFITSRPGNRLPHAWLSGMVPGKRLSTIDLAGHCAFTIFTGHGGEAWKQAAIKATKVLGVPINCYSIGWGLEYHDMYRDWFKKREIEDNGMLLVRPDRYVAWRSIKLISDAEEKLLYVFRRILSREETS